MDPHVVPPPWRDRVERLTRLAIGVATQMVPTAAGTRDRAGVAVDVAVGALTRSQAVVLDATERVVAAGTVVSRLPVVAVPTGVITRVTRRAVEPVRVRGHAVRVAAVRDARVEMPELAGRAMTRAIGIVPVNRIIEQVDLDAVLQRVDVDGIIRRVSIQGVIDRVDMDALLQRVDVAQLVDRIDVNTIVSRVDLDGLVGRTDIAAVIVQSTGGVASNAVDLVRRQGVGLDELVASFAARIRQRALRDSPAGPPLLAGERVAQS